MASVAVAFDQTNCFPVIGGKKSRAQKNISHQPTCQNQDMQLPPKHQGKAAEEAYGQAMSLEQGQNWTV